MLRRLLILLWLIPAASGATPLLDIGTQYVSRYATSGGFGWWSRYDISFRAQDLIIDVDVQLLGDDPGLDLIQQWEQGIEHIWGDAFDIVDGSYLYDLVFNVDWVDSGADQLVNVVAGTGPTNMRKHPTWR